MFRLVDLVKDLRLADDLYGEVGIDTPLTEATRQLFEKALGEYGERDIAAIADLWREPSATRQPLR
jgi:3-hydroxyisobutyrate dehydrogenase-like beta-hydroxyacid dehydrogenase